MCRRWIIASLAGLALGCASPAVGPSPPFAVLRYTVPRCVAPGQELRLAAWATVLPGAGTWEHAGVGLEAGAGFIDGAPAITRYEGLVAHGSAPHFEHPAGAWGISGRAVHLGEGETVGWEAVARVRRDAPAGEHELRVLASAWRAGDRREQSERVTIHIAPQCPDSRSQRSWR